METLLAALIAVGVTLFFVRGYLKQLARGAKQGGGASPAGAPAGGAAGLRPCPRCGKTIARGTAFCAHCGAALAMWQVHSAAIQTGTSGGKGRPQPIINASLCVGCGSCVHACLETGTLELIGGKAILAHLERCVGHGVCAEVCPTNAITLAIGGILQTVKVPLVKENFETNLPGVFIVGELGGMGLIKTAINEGKLVIDHLRDRRAKEEAPAAPEGMVDVAIIGAGPAGISASLTAQQYGLRYLTFEQGEIASTIRQYPRQKFLMAEPIELPLYGSLYVADGTKEALLAVWETILANTGVRVQTNERVERIQRNHHGFEIVTNKGTYRARWVVLAIGKRGTPRRLGVPGEDLAKVSYRLIEADSYQDKHLLVVGGGDSAIEAALALSRSGTNRVTLSYRGDSFQRARERNRQFLETALKSEKIQVRRRSEVVEIGPASVTLIAEGNKVELSNDYAIILIGGESPDDFLRRTGIEIVEKALSV
jgi:putative YpdA family bacillithiol system oxidoreductase